MSNGLGGNALTRNIWFEALPSTSCALCTCKVWSCYGQWLRRCIYKKIHYLTLTLGSRPHQMLPSTLDIMWPMHQQSLMLLHPTVKESAFTRKYIIWPWPWGQGHTKYCPVPSTSCDQCTSKVWCCCISRLRRCIYKKIHYMTLTLGSRPHKTLPSTLDIMLPMHQQSLMLLHLTAKEKMHLQENTLLLYMKWCPVPSTSCDLSTYRVWSYYVKRFRRRCIYKKIHYLTLGSRSHEMLPSTLYIMWPMQLQSLKLLCLTV